jgi:hypothetical protein
MCWCSCTSLCCLFLCVCVCVCVRVCACAVSQYSCPQGSAFDFGISCSWLGCMSHFIRYCMHVTKYKLEPRHKRVGSLYCTYLNRKETIVPWSPSTRRPKSTRSNPAASTFPTRKTCITYSSIDISARKMHTSSSCIHATSDNHLIISSPDLPLLFAHYVLQPLLALSAHQSMSRSGTMCCISSGLRKRKGHKLHIWGHERDGAFSVRMMECMGKCIAVLTVQMHTCTCVCKIHKCMHGVWQEPDWWWLGLSLAPKSAQVPRQLVLCLKQRIHSVWWDTCNTDSVVECHR